jgi:integrase
LAIKSRLLVPTPKLEDFVFLRGLYRYARLEWGLEVTCPTEDVSPPAPPRNREPILTLAEIERLLDWCCVSASPTLYSYVLILLHTAMRPSEAASLTWPQVRQAERTLVLNTTKTGRSRLVPLTRQAVAQLDTLREINSGSTYVFLPAHTKPQRIASEFFKRSFATACRNAGISGITLYSLRHIAASYLIMLGVDIRTVGDIMGHSDISMTMRYTHLLTEHKIAAVDVLDRLGR